MFSIQGYDLAFFCVAESLWVMAKEVTHLLLTRFNTAADFAPSRLGLQTAWLTQRLALFERYCLPSVAAQHGADFHWLVFFDADSPAWLRQKVETYKRLMTPIYVEGTATDRTIADSVLKTGLVQTPYLLTTRLDNDDSLARSHLSRVARAFNYQDKEFILFPFGLQMYRGHVYQVYWPSNPFLSLVEKVQGKDGFTTVFCVPHNHVHSAGPVTTIWCSSQWMQVLHGSNLLNALRGWPRLRSRSHPDFEVRWPETAEADSIASRISFSAGSYKARANKFGGKLAARLAR
jgi:Putative rhamnosyl transferase